MLAAGKRAIVNAGPMNCFIAGLELGGTKCILVLGRPDGSIVDEVRIPTRDPEGTLGEALAQLDKWREGEGFAGIGIASFGPLDLDLGSNGYGTIVTTPKRGWSGVPVVQPFRRYGVPIGLDTDVIGAARAEQRWGAARGLTDFAYITVGTGVGVGSIINDRPVQGLGHGEMGHGRGPRLEGDSWPGACAYHGDCIEGLASGSAIAARSSGQPVGEDWPGWNSVEHALAMLVHNLFLATQPRRILMGGGVVKGRPSLIEAVGARARESLAGYHTASAIGDDFLVAPGLGEGAGPLGALALAIEATRTN